MTIFEEVRNTSTEELRKTHSILSRYQQTSLSEMTDENEDNHLILGGLQVMAENSLIIFQMPPELLALTVKTLAKYMSTVITNEIVSKELFRRDFQEKKNEVL